MKSLLIAAWLVALIAPVSAGNLLFILDASGSMRGKVDGKPKIETAKTTLIKLIGDLPPDMKVGLMAYGHREKNSCKDVEVLLPVGHATSSAVSAQLTHIAAKGKTPIAYALEQSANAFVGLEKGPNNVVLISDGIETCNGDPCAIAGKIAKSNINVRVDVVGFDISDKDRKQLECIAKLGKGKYFTAHSTSGFVSAVTKAVKVAQATAKPPPPPTPKPTKSVIFKDEFDGTDLQDVWQVKNPDSDAYIVEKGHLLMIAGGERAGFDIAKTTNIIQLNKNLPDGDWELNAFIDTQFQTGYDNVWLGFYKDERNFLAVRIYAEPIYGAWQLVLQLIKTTPRKTTHFEKQILVVPCPHSGCSQEQLLPVFVKAVKSRPIRFGLVKHGRKFSAVAQMVGQKDKAGNPIVYKTSEIASLRLPGNPALAVGQNKKVGGETLTYVDKVEIDSLK